MNFWRMSVCLYLGPGSKMSQQVLAIGLVYCGRFVKKGGTLKLSVLQEEDIFSTHQYRARAWFALRFPGVSALQF